MAFAIFFARPSFTKPDSVSMTATGSFRRPMRFASSIASRTGSVSLFKGRVARPSVIKMTTGSWFGSWR